MIECKIISKVESEYIHQCYLNGKFTLDSGQISTSFQAAVIMENVI